MTSHVHARAYIHVYRFTVETHFRYHFLSHWDVSRTTMSALKIYEWIRTKTNSFYEDFALLCCRRFESDADEPTSITSSQHCSSCLGLLSQLAYCTSAARSPLITLQLQYSLKKTFVKNYSICYPLICPSWLECALR